MAADHHGPGRPHRPAACHPLERGPEGDGNSHPPTQAMETVCRFVSSVTFAQPLHAAWQAAPLGMSCHIFCAPHLNCAAPCNRISGGTCGQTRPRRSQPSAAGHVCPRQRPAHHRTPARCGLPCAAASPGHPNSDLEHFAEDQSPAVRPGPSPARKQEPHAACARPRRFARVLPAARRRQEVMPSQISTPGPPL